MKHLKPEEAHDFLHQNPEAVLVDCRSEMEYLFVGHPAGAIMSHGTTGPTGPSIRTLSVRCRKSPASIVPSY
jgi:rhodanese-related sulfurtransferase